MQVRRARAGDARQIAEVHVRTWRAAYRHAFPAELLDGFSVDEREAMWRRALASGRAAVFVAEEDAGAVGFASAGTSEGEKGVGELYALYVAPEAWGSGAARELIGAVHAWLREHGFASALLWVLEDNPRARRFYEREGWRHDGGRTEQIRGVEVREALYRLRLDPAPGAGDADHP